MEKCLSSVYQVFYALTLLHICLTFWSVIDSRNNLTYVLVFLIPNDFPLILVLHKDLCSHSNNSKRPIFWKFHKNVVCYAPIRYNPFVSKLCASKQLSSKYNLSPGWEFISVYSSFVPKKSWISARAGIPALSKWQGWVQPGLKFFGSLSCKHM